MPDLYTLVAKIRSLPRRRIAEVEDFVDFLTLRRAGKAVPPSKGGPAEAVDRIGPEVNAGLADAKMQAHLAELGGAGVPLAPAQFSKLIAD